MPRRREVPKREVIPDPLYQSKFVTNCVNVLMRDGKKSLAERVFYDAMDLVKERTNEDPVKVFHKAVENIKPVVEVKSRRVGGSTYQVPVHVRPERRVALALRWLTSFARQRHEKTMMQKLAAEFLDAASNRGGTIKRRDDTHRMAEANKAFAHYRW